MTIILTRFNQTRTGYTKRDEHEISLSGVGEDDLNLLIRDAKASERPAKAWSFGRYEDGDMSGSTWQHASALMLDYALARDPRAAEQIITAARQLGVGHYIVTGSDRYGARTLAVVIPTTKPMNKDRYARLCYVLLEEMRLLGCRQHLVAGTSAMTHQLHLTKDSEAFWMPGPTLDAAVKIRATRTAAQDMDRDRFTVGRAAADAQLAPPTMTAAHDGLFEGL